MADATPHPPPDPPERNPGPAGNESTGALLYGTEIRGIDPDAMGPTKPCPQCGRAPPAGWRGGLCPACLLARGLEGYPTSEPAPADGGRDAELRSVGDYELMERLGAGGMGVVYRALQVSLDRFVAVKMLHGTQRFDAAGLRRFRAEAEAAARLEHPNIVRIHEIGEHAGQPFLAMEFIEGQRLADLVHERPLPPVRAAGYVLTLARAIGYAHARGVLHRDLKPSNVLVDGRDEPRILDFGLAKLLAGGEELTLSGSVLGSPGYMAPEQARGEPADVRSDVYSLGAILYAALTGRAPFQAASALETLRLAAERDPVPPRTFNPALPVDLETICLQCLAKEPSRRYASADQLAAELQRFLNDEPIRARRESLVERGARWCRRQPALAATLLTLALTGAAAFVGITSQWRRAESARAAEQRVNERLSRVNTALRLQQAEALLDAANPVEGLPILAQILRQQPTNALPGAMIAGYLASGNLLPLPLIWPNVGADVYDLAFTSDGSRLAAWSKGQRAVTILPVRHGELQPGDAFVLPASLGGDLLAGMAFANDGRSIVAASRNGEILWWDVTNRRFFRPPWRVAEGLELVRFAPGDEALLLLTSDDRLLLWDATGGSPARALSLAIHPLQPAFSPDGTHLAFLDAQGQLHLVETVTGRETKLAPAGGGLDRFAWAPLERQLLAAPRDGGLVSLAWPESPDAAPTVTRWASDAPRVECLAFSPDGTRVATAHRDHTIRVWSTATRASVGQPMRTTGRLDDIAFARTNRWLIGHDATFSLHVWDVVTGQPVCAPLNRRERVQVWTLDPSGERLAFGNHRGELALVELEVRRPEHLALRHGAPVVAAAWNPQGNRVATGGEDGSVRLWDAVTGATNGIRLGPRATITALQFSPRDGSLLTASVDGTAQRWDSTNGLRLGPPLTHRDAILAASFSPDGRLIATASRDHTARVWTENGRPLTALLTHADEVRALAFSPDGAWLATAGLESGFRIWSLADGRLVRFVSTSGAVSVLRYNHPGDRLASGQYNGGVRVWNPRTGEPQSAIGAHAGRLQALEFMPDDRGLLQAGLDGTATIGWPETGPETQRTIALEGAINQAALAHAGHWVITGLDHGEVQLHDAATGLRLARLASHGGAVTRLVPSPDGQRVLTASLDGSAHVLRLPEIPEPAPGWLPDLAEALARHHLGPDGRLVGDLNWTNAVARFVEQPPPGPFATWIRSLILPPARRDSPAESR